MWGIIPAAGAGSRIQPLAFSKELLPVGSRIEHGIEHPRAVSEYLMERMALAGVDKFCFVIAPGKSDILAYYGGGAMPAATVSFVVQPRPAGLCDAVFRSAPLVAPEETVVIGLPDTIWFPEDGLCALGETGFELLLFPVACPQYFDVVEADADGNVTAVHVKPECPVSEWIWGAIKMRGEVFEALHQMWIARGAKDEFLGSLFQEWIARGGKIRAVKAGVSYVDVGTLNGYREALRLLDKAGEIPETAAMELA